MFIRILGVDYNVSLIKTIQLILPKRMLLLHFIGDDEAIKIVWLKHHDIQDVVDTYAKLMKMLKSEESGDITLDQRLMLMKYGFHDGWRGAPYEGAHPKREFISGNIVADPDNE